MLFDNNDKIKLHLHKIHFIYIRLTICNKNGNNVC